MNDKKVPKRTLERKKREAEALKANMKKRKVQAKLLSRPANLSENVSEESNE